MEKISSSQYSDHQIHLSTFCITHKCGTKARECLLNLQTIIEDYMIYHTGQSFHKRKVYQNARTLLAKHLAIQLILSVF